MEKSDLTHEQFDRLAEAIFPTIAEQGPSRTTMDYLARRLSMSKRTLYEIFGSKDEMVSVVMDYLHKKRENEIRQIAAKCDNMMEVMVNVMIFHQKTMSSISAAFFRDLDERYRHLRPDYESHSQAFSSYMLTATKLGVKQGVFRSDANYKVIIPLIRIQMESLKRMEEFFPADITIVEGYNAIVIGLLRSIATPKGMRILDKLTPKFKIETENIK